MNEIRTLLRVAARRLELGTFLNVLHAVLIGAASLALALMLADRAPAATFVPWLVVVPVLAALSALVTVLLWMPRRRREEQVALLVDERLDLREKLSTALACQGLDDPFAQAALADAVETARQPRVQELVRRRFRVEAPRGWWISPLILFAAVLCSFVAPLDLFGDDEPEIDPARAVSGQVQESIDAVVQTIRDQPLLNRELADTLGDLARAKPDPNALSEPQEMRREAIKDATEINKALDRIINGEKGKTAEALEKMLGQLRTPEDGPAKELAEALARADFKGAQDQLNAMLEQMKAGDMPPEQQKQLAEQLQAVAEQLQQLAQEQERLEQALKQAGLDPQLAQNPQALQQAIQNNPNLNQQQQQQLQQMAQAQQAAAQACEGMGQAMQQMAQAMQAGQLGQMGQAGQQMGQQLNQMEQLQMLLQQAQAAANMCQGQCQGLGQGLGMQQAMQQWAQQGGAFGNRGQGAGGRAPLAPTPTGTRITKADTVLQEGDIIARQLFEGPQITGESRAKLQQLLAEIKQGWEEGLTEEQLPRRYHEPSKHYFGEFEESTRVIIETDESTDAKESSGSEASTGSGSNAGE